jgi:phosphoglycolate phosphatase-like HAD superfamily hydrolase
MIRRQAQATILGRLRDILAQRAERAGDGWTPVRVDQEARRIHEGYWGTYRSATHVLPEVPETLEDLRLRRQIPLGVVSNFMVPGGVPDLLGHHGLARFFGPVVVSCDLGWRKPSEKIFQAAIDAAGVEPGEILFIGEAPGRHGAARTGIPFGGDESGRRPGRPPSAARLRWKPIGPVVGCTGGERLHCRVLRLVGRGHGVDLLRTERRVAGPGAG